MSRAGSRLETVTGLPTGRRCMETLDTLRKLFEYDAWANRETLASLRAATVPPERALRILGHVAGAKRLWLSRLRRDGAATAPWPDLGLDALAKTFEESAGEWRSFLGGLRPDDLGRPVPYSNSKGETFTSSIGDILLQLVSHGSYHRGQAAVLLREAGQQPASTDYIHAVRKGLIP
jgi:uncharacterized damage-inducible protein DinB